MWIRQPTLALKPRGDVTRNPKQAYQWPQKRTCVRQKLFKKNTIQKKKNQQSDLIEFRKEPLLCLHRQFNTRTRYIRRVSPDSGLHWGGRDRAEEPVETWSCSRRRRNILQWEAGLPYIELQWERGNPLYSWEGFPRHTPSTIPCNTSHTYKPYRLPSTCLPLTYLDFKITAFRKAVNGEYIT